MKTQPHQRRKNLTSSISALICAAITLYFFGFYSMTRGIEQNWSILRWAYENWNPHYSMAHGHWVPFLSLLMLFYKRQSILTASVENPAGLKDRIMASAWIALSGLLFYSSFRIFQPRLALASLPILLTGSVYFLWGWRTARSCAPALFFFYIAIPLPSFQQSTVGLQHLACQAADQLNHFLGVDSTLRGTNVYASNGEWGPYNVTGGCSGIRSLMSLFMISYFYAYTTQHKFWKFLILLLSAFPIAILANTARVTSICLVADKISPEFAETTWHDWSGVLLFYPFSIFCLITLHLLLSKYKLFRTQRRRPVGTSEQ